VPYEIEGKMFVREENEFWDKNLEKMTKRKLAEGEDKLQTESTEF